MRFEETIDSLDNRVFGREEYDVAETQRERDVAVRRRENSFNDANKLEAVIEEQEEIENMYTVRGLFGLKPKEDIVFTLLTPKQTLIKRIREKLKMFINP